MTILGGCLQGRDLSGAVSRVAVGDSGITMGWTQTEAGNASVESASEVVREETIQWRGTTVLALREEIFTDWHWPDTVRSDNSTTWIRASDGGIFRREKHSTFEKEGEFPASFHVTVELDPECTVMPPSMAVGDRMMVSCHVLIWDDESPEGRWEYENATMTVAWHGVIGGPHGDLEAYRIDWNIEGDVDSGSTWWSYEACGQARYESRDTFRQLMAYRCHWSGKSDEVVESQVEY